ncbi:MAG: hypothetical protein H7X95_04745 [Deltaproteobacteria bacterium]|nr:hypothetical protein [Deltaproteobacteria bacterium]
MAAVRFVLLMLAVVGAGNGCSDSTTYTYFDVHLTIDRATVTDDQLYLVTGCEVNVRDGDRNETIHLRCRENKVPRDVGSFQWTSDAKSGNVQFVVRMLDGNLKIIAEATTDPIPVSPGKHVPLEVKVVGVASPITGDAGITDTSTDASADGTTPDAGAVDQTPG